MKAIQPQNFASCITALLLNGTDLASNASIGRLDNVDVSWHIKHSHGFGVKGKRTDLTHPPRVRVLVSYTTSDAKHVGRRDLLEERHSLARVNHEQNLENARMTAMY